MALNHCNVSWVGTHELWQQTVMWWWGGAGGGGGALND